mgnify:CR=1 FL=1
MNRSIASMNIILHALEDHVEKSWIREDDRISLTGCALLDTIGSPVQPDTLYICTPQTLTADLLAHGINAVCCGMPNVPEAAIGPRTSLIVVKDVTLELTANKVISFFASQSQLFFDLGNAALAKHDPENLIQIAAGYSGLALALLDINQSIVARSMQGAQIDNPRRRLPLTRSMQALGVSSLFLCVVTMFLIYVGMLLLSAYVFGAALLLLIASLGVSLWEIQISVRALDIHLKDMESV